MAVLFWPILAVLLIGLLWLDTAQKISEERATAETAVRTEAFLAASSYAQQLAHTVEQVDAITLRLKYYWESPAKQVDLEGEGEAGLFPEGGMLYANIFDANGDLQTTSTRGAERLNASRRPYFQFHQAECCTGLLISPPSKNLRQGIPVVRFTRRLDRPDGEFDGVVSVSVEPGYLVTFEANPGRAETDFVSVRLTQGPILASKVGSTHENAPIFYRQDPVFPVPSGVVLEPAEKFQDGRTRFVAWRKLEKYPIAALVGVSVQEAFAPVEAAVKGYRDTAILGSALLLVLSLITAKFTAAYVTRRRQAEETRETYRLATDAANEGFYMVRPIYGPSGQVTDFRLDDCNNRAAELVGTTREQLLGIKASELKPDAFREGLLVVLRRAVESGFLEDELRVPPQSPFKVKWLYRRIVRSNAGLALTVRDISEVKEHEQALAELANNDTLTKLPNRNWLNHFLPDAISRGAASTGHLAVLFIDLDNFKNVNDTLGHEAGDELLVQAAQRLKNAVRASDHVARLGGDEFVVILDHVEVVEDVAKVARAIIDGINKPFALATGTANQINASVGISVFPEDGTDAETLLKHADVAMYAAKAAGKGRYAFYHTHLSDSLLLRLSKEQALRDAVERDEFVVHYQPRVGTSSGRLTSMEALVRWDHPERGMVYPSDFIDVAEDIGVIVKLGEIVIEKVCRQIVQWKEQGLPLVPVSVNVSAQQLKSGTLSAFIATCIDRYRLEPALVEVELTESAVIDRGRVVSEELAGLRSLGIKLMIDDFGTGYSSLAQLHRLDVDVLKVDQTFTKALSAGSEGRLLFTAIVSMANALDMCVVAEGVETADQLTVLQKLSCDEIQGYLVATAVPAREMGQFMLKRILLPPSSGAGHAFAV